MSRKHTPGPWRTHANGHDIVTGDNFFIASIEGEVATPNDNANAQLIAAAPDLLAALEYLLEQTVDMDLEYGVELTEGEQDARRQALEAIGKAVGE